MSDDSIDGLVHGVSILLVVSLSAMELSHFDWEVHVLAVAIQEVFLQYDP